MPSKSRLKLIPLSAEDDAFLETLIEELNVSNPKWTKIKLRYLLMGLAANKPEAAGPETIAAMLPYTPGELAMAEKVEYINKAMRNVRISREPKSFERMYAALELRRKKLSKTKRKEFLEEIGSVSDAALELQKTLGKESIKSFFENYSEPDHYDDPTYPYRKSYLSTIRAVANLQALCISIEEEHAQGRGRPSHRLLNEYVAEIARAYEALSKKKFTVERHFDQSQNGEPVAITPGHRFVEKILSWTEKEDFEPGSEVQVFTKKNIYNACEAAQQIMNAE